MVILKLPIQCGLEVKQGANRIPDGPMNIADSVLTQAEQLVA